MKTDTAEPGQKSSGEPTGSTTTSTKDVVDLTEMSDTGAMGREKAPIGDDAENHVFVPLKKVSLEELGPSPISKPQAKTDRKDPPELTRLRNDFFSSRT